MLDAFAIKRPTLIFIGILVVAVTVSRLLYAPSDDAYIFLVYAKNFLQGNGLTFNEMIVEGFSSPLWMALLTLFGMLRVPLPLLMQILSTLSGLFTFYVTYRFSQKVLKDQFWALLPPILLAGSGDFVFYMGVGLEQVLFVGLIVLSISEAWDDPNSSLKGTKLAIIFTLLILTRPEGGLFAFLILIWGLIRVKSIWLPTLTGIKLTAMLTPILILRRLYFGFWLPNTYYVKSNSGLMNQNLGKVYLIRNGLRYWPIVVLVIILLLIMLGRKNFRELAVVSPLFLMSAAWGGYVWVVGGDNLVGGRMLVPVLPLIFIATIMMMKNVIPKPGWAAAIVLLSATLTFIGYTQNEFVQVHAQRWRRNFPVRQAAGLHLRENFPQDTLVALNPAGIIPYYSELPTIDMLGLNDEYIGHFGKRDYTLDFGHQAGDGYYVLSREPDVILFGGGVSAKPGDLISDREISQHPSFDDLE
jgi:hypothetical protein